MFRYSLNVSVERSTCYYFVIIANVWLCYSCCTNNYQTAVVVHIRYWDQGFVMKKIIPKPASQYLHDILATLVKNNQGQECFYVEMLSFIHSEYFHISQYRKYEVIH